MVSGRYDEKEYLINVTNPCEGFTYEWPDSGTIFRVDYFSITNITLVPFIKSTGETPKPICMES